MDLEELRRLNEARTQGKWFGRWAGCSLPAAADDVFFGPAFWPLAIDGVGDTPPSFRDEGCIGGFRNPDDPPFIAAIANATPALLEEISSGREREAKLTEALIEAAQVIGELAGDGWLADDTMEHMPGVKRARKLLARAVFADALEQSQ